MAILSLSAIGYLLADNAEDERTASRRVEHTHDVLDVLVALKSSLAQTEAALRGYGITHNDDFATEYRAAVLALRDHQRQARRLMSDNAEQLRHVDRLDTRLDERVEMFNMGFASALRDDFDVPQRAHDLSEEIVAEIDAMLRTERELLGRRERLREERAEQVFKTSVLGLAVASFLVVGVVLLLARQNKRREQTARELLEKQAIVDVFLETASDVVYVKDREGKHLLINRAGAALLGASPEEIIGKRLRDFLPPELALELEKDEAKIFSSGDSLVTEQVGFFDGEEHVYSATRTPYRDADGLIVGLIGVARDVTAQKRLEEDRIRGMTILLELGELLTACRTSDEAYAVIERVAPRFFDEQSGAVCLFQSSRNLVEARAVWGQNVPLRQPYVLEPDDCWALRRGRQHLASNEAASMRCKHVLEGEQGSTLCLPMLANGELIGMFTLSSPKPIDLVFRERTAVLAEQIALALSNIALRETLRNQSIRDPLTGLFNRRYTEETMARELSRAGRVSEPVSVLMIDVDHFKKFNDTFGHEAGDVVLRELGLLLKRWTRSSDMASRMGGEELLVVLPSTSKADATAKAEALRAEIERLDVKHRGEPIGPVTASIGLASFPTDGTTSEELLRNADAALYRAKREGRNRVVGAED